MAKIIRVFGKADSFDIELSDKGGHWEVDVPPDLVDGVYAVRLTAINEFNEVSYWIGELFMCNGVCAIKFTESPYNVSIVVSSNKSALPCDMNIICKDYVFDFTNKYTVEIRKKLKKALYPVEFKVSNYTMTIDRRCPHGK